MTMPNNMTVLRYLPKFFISQVFCLSGEVNSLWKNRLTHLYFQVKTVGEK